MLDGEAVEFHIDLDNLVEAVARTVFLNLQVVQARATAYRNINM